MNITSCDATLGAIVRDVRLDALDNNTFASIELAWHRYAVLIFPEQHLSGEAHLEFSRRFGQLEKGIRQSAKPNLSQLTNVDEHGAVVPQDDLKKRFQLGNQQWHSDSSYKSVGAKASILAAHVVPGSGGETEWADMRAAYDALDENTRARLQGKTAVHSYQFSHTWHGGLEVLNDDELERLPPVEHPVIRTHPETGRLALFVGRHASHIVGEDLESSRALLARVTEEACQRPRTLKHSWSPGDIAIWDNRCVLHRGHDWPASEARVMVRTTVAGDENGNAWALNEESA